MAQPAKACHQAWQCESDPQDSEGGIGEPGLYAHMGPMHCPHNTHTK